MILEWIACEEQLLEAPRSTLRSKQGWLESQIKLLMSIEISKDGDYTASLGTISSAVPHSGARNFSFCADQIFLGTTYGHCLLSFSSAPLMSYSRSRKHAAGIRSAIEFIWIIFLVESNLYYLGSLHDRWSKSAKVIDITNRLLSFWDKSLFNSWKIGKLSS